MTANTSRWGPSAVNRPVDGASDDPLRFGVRCPRCARTQPPTAGVAYRCAFCGTPLPVRRWVAHPPPGAQPPRRVRLLRRPYAGPPSYRRGHPTWGFPPVIWRNARVAGGAQTPPTRVRGLLAVVLLAAATAVVCVVAAGAESWRFALMLAGRTQVLAGGPVHASDVMVLAAGTTALVLGVVTALAALPVLVTLHRATAQRAGRAPSRSAAGLLARLVVPGWNLHGAGQVMVEIIRGLTAIDSRRRSARVTVPLWWLAWVANGLLVFATLVMAFGRGNQWMADTVELHIVVDLVGGLVAGLFAAALISFERSWTGRGSHRYSGWSVRPPESTPRNRSVGRVAGGGPEPAGGKPEDGGSDAGGDAAAAGVDGDETAVGPAAMGHGSGRGAGLESGGDVSMGAESGRGGSGGDDGLPPAPTPAGCSGIDRPSEADHSVVGGGDDSDHDGTSGGPAGPIGGT